MEQAGLEGRAARGRLRGRGRAPLRPAFRLRRGGATRSLLVAALALLLFILALRMLVLSAGALAGVFDGLGAAGALNFVGLGWLGSYLVLSGSPIAATALTLQDAGVLDAVEALAQIVGSRMGAAFVVLAVGFIAYRRGRALADGVYVGVVALLVTVTTYIPVAIVGRVALEQGWFDGIEIGALAPLLSFTQEVYDPALRPLRDAVPDVALFLAGLFLMLGALRLFDTVLPTPESTSGRLARAPRALHGRWLLFALGAAVTLVTLSVAVSLTLLIPLARQGVIRREAIVAFVLGANITTLADTLFAASVLEDGATGTVVVTVALLATAAAALVLIVLYRPYLAAINRAARLITRDQRSLAWFVGLIVAAPVALLLL